MMVVMMSALICLLEALMIGQWMIMMITTEIMIMIMFNPRGNHSSLKSFSTQNLCQRENMNPRGEPLICMYFIYFNIIVFRPTYNYENNEVRRKDTSSPYDTIPDLPPPESSGFPNLFQNLPGQYGKTSGFFGTFNTKNNDYSDSPSSYQNTRVTGKVVIHRYD